MVGQIFLGFLLLQNLHCKIYKWTLLSVQWSGRSSWDCMSTLNISGWKLSCYNLSFHFFVPFKVKLGPSRQCFSLIYHYIKGLVFVGVLPHLRPFTSLGLCSLVVFSLVSHCHSAVRSCTTHAQQTGFFVPISRLCVSQICRIDRQNHLVLSVKGNNWLLVPLRPSFHIKSQNMQL